MKNARDIIIQEIIRGIAIWAILIGIGIPVAQAISIDLTVALLVICVTPVVGFFLLVPTRIYTGKAFMITSERGFTGLRIFAAAIGIMIVVANTLQSHIPAVAAIGFISLILLVAYLFSYEKTGIHDI